MTSPLAKFAADHQTVLSAAAEAAGFADPIAFDPDDFAMTLLKHSKRVRFVPVGGAFIRDWDPNWRSIWPGMTHGLRLYRLGDITYARAYCSTATGLAATGFNIYIVDRCDYLRLYRRVAELKRKPAAAVLPPVMSTAHRDTLWRNTVDFLDPDNLKRITGYGGRAKRGLLLTGPPGNGKTSACRWIQEEAERRGWVAKTVSPDDYQAARKACNPAEAVKELFEANGRGVVFFDDLDIALRDREAVKETDDQAVFLSALDGIAVNEGVVYVFTTNCPVELIDPAFRRPGRIDLTLHFPKPDADLRRQLVCRWHPELRAAVGEEAVVADSAGMSFAEIDELKNLLVLRFLDANEWDWGWAREQFRANRDGLANKRADRAIGFAASANGKH